MGSFRHYIPNAPLSDFVGLFWYWKQTPDSTLERVLPGSTVELVIRLSENRISVCDGNFPDRRISLKGGCLTGPQAKYFVLDKNEQDHLIGVHFRAGGAFAVLGAPLTEFAGRHLSLEDIWGARAEDLRDEILEAPSIEARFAVLERRLLEFCRDSARRHPAVLFAMRELHRQPGSSLSALADEAGLSSRRLNQLFAREVGLAPKAFARLERFQRVLRRLQSLREVDWLEFALEAGYFDQAHFNHEFKEFSGFNPSTYMVRRTEHLSHVPM